MSGRKRKRMCVCCGEYYFMTGEPTHISERMCAQCVHDVDDLDADEWLVFMTDVEKVMEKEADLRYGDIPYVSVEELIAVMDH